MLHVFHWLYIIIDFGLGKELNNVLEIIVNHLSKQYSKTENKQYSKFV